MTNPTDQDPVIAGALRVIDVPAHRPGFWDAVGRRLDAEAAPADHGHHQATDHDDEDEHEHEQAHELVEPLRPRSGLPRVLAVAAVISAVVLAATFVTRRDDASRLRTAGPGEDTTATSTTAAADPATPTDGRADPTPDRAVIAWLQAIGDGDTDAAAALTGPASKAYVTSLGANLEGFFIEAGEGYGAWSVTPDLSTTEIDLGTEGGVTRAVVVVSGTWTGEGEDGFRVDALPVARTGSGPWLVEPWAFAPDTGGRLELISPKPGESGPGGLPPDGRLEVMAPGEGDFAFSLDDGEVARVAGQQVGANVMGIFDPPGELSSRTHLAVIAYVDGDETFTALAFTFLVEG